MQGNDYAARMVKKIFLIVRKAIRDFDRILRRISGNVRFPGIGRTTGRNVPATAGSGVSSGRSGGAGASVEVTNASGTSSNSNSNDDSDSNDDINTYNRGVNVGNISTPTGQLHQPTSSSSFLSSATSLSSVSLSISHLLSSIMQRVVLTSNQSSLSIRRASHYINVTISNAIRYASEKTRRILLYILRIILLGRM